MTYNQTAQPHREHARDFADGSEELPHPGDGTDAYWTEGVNYTKGAIRTTAQNLEQERAPITMAQWFYLSNNQKIGDFWVIDHHTGWTYWASMLDPEAQPTAYLLDAVEITSAIQETVFNGTCYYGFHVDNQLLSPDNSEDFINDGESHDPNLDYFLEGIKNNAVDEEWGNPAYNEDSAPSAFNYHLMKPPSYLYHGGRAIPLS